MSLLPIKWLSKMAKVRLLKENKQSRKLLNYNRLKRLKKTKRVLKCRMMYLLSSEGRVSAWEAQWALRSISKKTPIITTGRAMTIVRAVATFPNDRLLIFNRGAMAQSLVERGQSRSVAKP